MNAADRPLVSARVLIGLHSFLKERGCRGADVSRHYGFDVDQAIERNAYFDLGEVHHLFEIVALKAKDEAFGLHFGEACALHSSGVVHYAAANSPTLRSALQIRGRRSDIMHNGCELSYKEDSGIGSVRWKCNAVSGPRRQFVDYVASQLVHQIRAMLGDSAWMPLKVDLPHSRPGARALAEFERILGSRIVFGAPHVAVHVDGASLARSLPRADPALHRALMLSFDKLDKTIGTVASVVERARMLMIRDGQFVAESQQSVAHALNISIRTLQRELAGAGTSFRAVSDCARKQIALELLHDTDLPLTEAAFRLGFSELSAFSRAAKKWFGRTAGEVRLTQQDDDGPELLLARRRGGGKKRSGRSRSADV